MKHDRVLGFIPAKGGSTRFPRKNIAALGGKPLLGWAVDAARGSNVIDRIAVSSEDEEVLSCARDHGTDFALRRPGHLARDPAGIVDVAIHELGVLKEREETFDIIVILAPCAPLRTSADIAAAFDLFEKSRPNFVMSVTEYPHTPYAALSIGADGRLEPAFPSHFGKKSQEMPRAFRPNGAIHVLGVQRFLDTRSYLTPPLIPYVMPRDRSVDVDNPDDLEEARFHLARKTPGRCASRSRSSMQPTGQPSASAILSAAPRWPTASDCAAGPPSSGRLARSRLRRSAQRPSIPS
jgi:CMP-N,N'-diacetyllegionaminic acid synthase